MWFGDVWIELLLLFVLDCGSVIEGCEIAIFEGGNCIRYLTAGNASVYVPDEMLLVLLVLLGPVVRIGSGKAFVLFGIGPVVCVGSGEAAGR